MGFLSSILSLAFFELAALVIFFSGIGMALASFALKLLSPLWVFASAVLLELVGLALLFASGWYMSHPFRFQIGCIAALMIALGFGLRCLIRLISSQHDEQPSTRSVKVHSSGGLNVGHGRFRSI